MRTQCRRVGRVTRALVVAASVAVPGAAPPPAVAQPPDSAHVSSLLLQTLRDSRLSLTLTDGRLAGGGAALLLDEGRAAQFFLVGEEHGVAEIPALTAALFRALVPAGYTHLAIETGDGLAAALDSVARAPAPIDALSGFFAAHWPGAPFYTLREEAALLVDAVAASPAAQVLWGLDYDIMADRHALPRLRALASTAAERAAADRATAVADSLLRLAMEQGNPGHIMMFGGPESVLAELRRAWAPAPGTEAGRIIALLEETRRINGYWLGGEELASNHARARWNKQQFARYLQQAQAAAGAPPRVLLKFGAGHMMRGRTFTDVYDLGSLASEFADAHGGRSFHVLVIGGDGTQRAAVDPTVMQYRPAPAGFQALAWARPFFQPADTAGWSVYDVRPLRTLARQGRFGALHPALEKVIWGFDAVIVLTGSAPATMLPVDRPW